MPSLGDLQPILAFPIAALIRAAAHADPLKPMTNDHFDEAIGELRAFAARRALFVVGRSHAPSKRIRRAQSVVTTAARTTP